jgi:hypothetical protein
LTTVDIFREAEPPRGRRRSPLNFALWATWSPELLDFFARHRDGDLRARRPLLHHVRGCAPYGLTYRLPLERIRDPRFGDELKRIAAAFSLLAPRNELILLRNLFVAALDANRLHVFLTWLREAIAAEAADPRVALYSPASAERALANEFPLHADLFLVDKLLLVFDDVPVDGSGALLAAPRVHGDPSADQSTSQRRAQPHLVPHVGAH